MQTSESKMSNNLNDSRDRFDLYKNLALIIFKLRGKNEFNPQNPKEKEFLQDTLFLNLKGEYSDTKQAWEMFSKGPIKFFYNLLENNDGYDPVYQLPHEIYENKKDLSVRQDNVWKFTYLLNGSILKNTGSKELSIFEGVEKKLLDKGYIVAESATKNENRNFGKFTLTETRGSFVSVRPKMKFDIVNKYFDLDTQKISDRSGFKEEVYDYFLAESDLFFHAENYYNENNTGKKEQFQDIIKNILDPLISEVENKFVCDTMKPEINNIKPNTQ